MSGWVKRHRRILQWEWYTDVPVCRLFDHLILTSNHKDVTYRGKVYYRGQKLTSRAKLSLETGLSEQEIRTALAKLKSTNELTIKATKKETVITICKYDTYQGKDEDFNQPINQPINQQSTNQSTNNQPSNEQEGKKRRMEEDRIITPPTPLERGDCVSSSRSRLSAAQKKRKKHPTLTDGMKRLGALFGRRHDTLWSVYEYEAYRDIKATEDEVTAIESFYALRSKQGNGPDLWKHDLATLLNQWSEQMDRAISLTRQKPRERGIETQIRDSSAPNGWRIAGFEIWPQKGEAYWQSESTWDEIVKMGCHREIAEKLKINTK